MMIYVKKHTIRRFFERTKFMQAFRTCLNFLQKVFSASFELLFGLFSSFYSSHSPLCSSQKQKNILKKNSQKKAEQNSNRFLKVSRRLFAYRFVFSSGSVCQIAKSPIGEGVVAEFLPHFAPSSNM